MSRSLGARVALATVALATTALVAGSAAAHSNAPGGPGRPALGPGGGHGAFDSHWPGRVGRFHGRGSDFVQQTGPDLRLHGRPFRFAGTNNYYLIYKSQLMVDDVLNAAAAQGFDVVRTWGFMDQNKEGVQFQNYDAAAGKPVVDEGAAGLEHLDYVIAKADELGLKLVIPFTNNWSDFGGMDQYVQWLVAKTGDTSLLHHDTFYTDPTIRHWYKAYISTLLNHVNAYTGVKYKDDSTIMTWELGNEPRCKGSGALPPTASCNTHTLIRWADEMSRYIKSIDRNHLVSVGDEGFYCTDPSSSDWTTNCGEGVDTVAFARLSAIDVMSFHLYPDSWGKDADWGTQWIKSHFEAARAVGKPAMLGEFGLADKSVRNPVYKTWLDAAFRSGGAGALYWILSGKQDDGTLYPDYDGFTVYCPSPVCTTIANFGKQMNAGFPLSFAPVADDDTAVTEFETPATLPVTANDIAYFPASVVAGSVDLDPATARQQTTFTVAGRGTFAVASDGSVTFTPDSGFNGKVTATYVVRDTFGRLSNAANIVVNVKPSPTAAMTLFDFEDGTQGWAGASWQNNSLNTLTQSSSNASQGSYSLHIQSGGGYWFGVEPFGPVDLSSRTSIRVDLTSTTGTSGALALKVGPGWDWCQITVPGWFTTPQVGEADMGAGGALTFDLTTLGDSCRSKLTEVHALYLAVDGGSDTYIDYVRAY